MAARGPTAMPACGPPSSLSPLKVTISTPGAATRAPRALRRTARRSASAPLPRSSMTTRRARGRSRELVERGLRGEADDAVVAGVHAQHRARALASRRARRRADRCGWWCPPRPGGRRSRRRMSGMRKPSPISTSSPRETITSPSRSSISETRRHRTGQLFKSDLFVEDTEIDIGNRVLTWNSHDLVDQLVSFQNVENGTSMVQTDFQTTLVLQFDSNQGVFFEEIEGNFAHLRASKR